MSGVDFSSAIAAAAAAAPHRVARTAGRVLLVDGDALAYTAAGNEDCSPGQARVNLRERIRKALIASGADTVEILVTASGSHKGHRYAIARAKPYQGQRSSGRRPKNWLYLRQLLEQGEAGYPVFMEHGLEADDIFAHRSVELGAERVVIHTQDKDMRMVPGWHLNWDDFTLHYHEPGLFRSAAWGKEFGHAWFWQQLLYGDPADNIPGLPWFFDGFYSSGANKGKIKKALCGARSNAVKGLAFKQTNEQSLQYCLSLYEDVYQDRAKVELLEQACLLWMRRTPNLFDCLLPGGPLFGMLSLDEAWVQQEILDRTKVHQLQGMG